MKKLIAVLAQSLVCAALLAIPIKGFADEAQPEGNREVASEVDSQLEDQLNNEIANLPNFEPSSDMKHALHELPEVADE